MVPNLSVGVFLVLFCYLQSALSQGTGSGTNGNLRLCVVEGRGQYKNAAKHCPILDKDKSGVECVLGTDRLDCLRRISKGAVDFGVFSPEDLFAAQWAKIDVLVTNELRIRNRSFARNIVALVNKRILPDSTFTLHGVLQNTTLCHPGETTTGLRPISETLSAYLETLVLERSCDPKLSTTENKLKALADFYGKACKAGAWVPDKTRDAELKRDYPSLCAACGSSQCSDNDRFRGSVGALTCLAEGVGDVTWVDADDVEAYFKLKQSEPMPGSKNFAYLCRDNSWMELDHEPCVWFKSPWNVIVAKRKAAEAVSNLAKSLTNNTVTISTTWPGALLALLEVNQHLPEPLHPPITPFDYLAKAEGFREAYSQTGCDPPRHINLCTTSLLARNKCEWMSEAGSVYGLEPPLQCVMRNNTEECMKAVATGDFEATVGNSDDLIPATRLNLTPLLHEVTPIVEKTNTVFAYVNTDSKITKMADLRGKRAAFPRYDGAVWHSVLQYITTHEKISCKSYIDDYFGEICAPGMDGKKCYEAGEEEALKSLVDGKSDVAFISMNTYNSYKNATSLQNTTQAVLAKIDYIRPEDNKKYGFIGWSNLGHIFGANNQTAIRKHEIINLFTKLDQIFGNGKSNKNPMFLMYGAFNHNLDVIFHSNTKKLATTAELKMHPFNKNPFNFELSVNNSTNLSCNFGAKVTPSLVNILVALVAFLINS